MVHSLAIVLLAAGKGTRMVSDIPKVLHKIAHRPMLLHAVETARELNPERIITVLSPQMEQVEAILEGKSQIAIQQQQNGTADALRAALPALEGFSGTVLVLYADTPLLTKGTLAALITTIEEGAAVAVLGFKPKDAAEYGRLVVDKKGQLERIVEYKDASDSERAIGLCNSGVMAMAGAHMRPLLEKIKNNNAKGEYYLTDMVELAGNAKLKLAHVVCDEEEVLGVNNRQQLAEADTALQHRLRAKAMAAGVTMLSPESVYLAYDTRFGHDVTLEPNVVFGPGVTLGDGVTIRAFSHVEGATLGRGVTVGPFARLRPGTRIAEGARIGNFVEVKAATIHQGAKINHLSYVGDAEIGKGSNIGAGTITCNYDGVNKHRTEIGAEVFIGSDVALVAPVKIGDGAIIAAGSVITEPVPQDALAFGRSRQSNKTGGAKKLRDKIRKKP